VLHFVGTTGSEVLSTPVSQTVWNLTAVGDSSGRLTVHGKGSRRAVKEFPETDTCYVCGTFFAFGLETAHMIYPILDSLMTKGRHCEISSYSVALTNKTPVTPLPPTQMITSWGTWVDVFVFCAGNWNVLYCGKCASQGWCFLYCNVAVLQDTFKD